MTIGSLAKVSVGCKGLFNLEENIMFFVLLAFMVTSHRSAHIGIESRSLFSLLAVLFGTNYLASNYLAQLLLIT
jgi:hypothetical protein